MYQWQADKSFTKIIPHVLTSEGGFVNDPDDPGGPTKYGISWNANQEQYKRLGITRDRVRDLTLEQAREIYYWKYWIDANCHKVRDIDLQYIHFDAAVNHGVGASLEMLYDLKPNPMYYEGNGKNQALFTDFFLDYLILRAKRYVKDRNRKKYLEGWVNRLIHVHDISEELEL
jgi:hypothetical protein